MPLFDFKCSACGTRFEEIVRRGTKGNPLCPMCHSDQTVKLIPKVNHQFGEPTRTQDGDSGVSSIDENLDQKIGRDAERRRKEIEKREAHKAKIREQTGAAALTRKGDTYVPLSEKVRQQQAKVAKGYNRGRKGLDGWTVIGDA